MNGKTPSRRFECPACSRSDYRMSTRGIGEQTRDRCPRCGGAMRVAGDRTPGWLSGLLAAVSGSFEVEDFAATEDRGEFEVSSPDPKTSFGVLLKDLRRRGYISTLRDTGEGHRLFVMKHPRAGPGRVWVNLLLFGATFLTTFLAGYFLLFGTVAFALAFAVAIMLMLGTHELGHKVSAWRNGVDATPPYFIPFPAMLGTLGAVIRIRSPPPSRDALVEMGVAGPLAGFAIALPLTLIGLLRSVPVAPPAGIPLPVAPLAFALFQAGIFGQVSSALALHPLAFAGWVTMLLTMFNLLPAGQLDGGHVARGVLNRQRHFDLTRAVGFALLMSGFLVPQFPFWIWGLLIFFMFRDYHAGALDDVSGLSRRAKLLALTSAAVFVLCLPVPVG